MAATTITGEMRSLSTVEARLPPGFRFHPNDEELVCDYLLKWLTGDQILLPNQYCPSLIQVHLNNCEPWDIPETACVGGKEWYFYSQQDRKYATGVRTNRATASGYWKATGKDRPIFQKECLVGMRKTLVFHKGRAPRGTKTDWVMHEFRLQGTTLAHNTISTNPDMENWVLCRVSYKKKTSGKQETERICEDKTSDLSPSAIMYDQNTQWCIEQVPCFSIYTPAQTSPTFCLNTNIINPTGPEDLPTNPIIPTYGAWVNIGTYY